MGGGGGRGGGGRGRGGGYECARARRSATSVVEPIVVQGDVARNRELVGVDVESGLLVVRLGVL